MIFLMFFLLFYEYSVRKSLSHSILLLKNGLTELMANALALIAGRGYVEVDSFHIYILSIRIYC